MQQTSAATSKTANYFTFIPRSPTKDAWDRRLMRGCSNLKELVETLRAIIKGPNPSLKFHLRGQIAFRRPHPSCPEMDDFHEFSGVTELASVLEGLQWSPDTIKQIYFYEHGYLRVED